MAELSQVFEDHLKSLSDDEWNALAQRVRTPEAPPPSQPLPNERRDEPKRQFANPGQQEAFRRGFIDADGKPVKQ